MDRQPDLVKDNEMVRELQELEAARHEKINTLEQARLDAIARLAMADSYTNPEHARRIEKVQQNNNLIVAIARVHLFFCSPTAHLSFFLAEAPKR